MSQYDRDLFFGADDHDHLATLKTRKLLDDSALLEVLLNAFQQLHAKFLMGHFRGSAR